jgi:hypothetical protein
LKYFGATPIAPFQIVGSSRPFGGVGLEGAGRGGMKGVSLHRVFRLSPPSFMQTMAAR